MINYRFPEEKEILLHYAKILHDGNVEKILTKQNVESPEEAKQLAHFFWKMIDQTIIDSDNKISIANQSNLEGWCEWIMQSLRSHFIAKGYMHIWEDESDKA